MIATDFSDSVRQAADYLSNANSVFVVTGAGISADSGLPTYRGIGGLYDDVDTEDGIPIEKALSGPVFRERPEITWKYLAEIELGARGATFNRGHSVLAEMEKHFDRFWILTQNVDGFHSEAGSKNVIEIHGNLHRMKCTVCSYRKTYDDYSDFRIPPICPDCGHLVRPDVVLFAEQLPEKEIETLYRESQEMFDVVISIGTSSYFPYIVQPVFLAHQLGIPTIEINPGETTLSEIVDVKIPIGAAESLDQIWNLIKN
ncbi:MAG: NAD-dependent protein deacylase [Planctomycetota bacterium]